MRKWKYKWSPSVIDNLTVLYWIGDEISSQNYSQMQTNASQLRIAIY